MELQFLVMAEMDGTVTDLSNRLVRELEGAVAVRSRSFDWMGNWVQVADNEDYDPDAVDDPEEGFLAFRFRIEVSPTQTVDIAHQVRAAVLLSHRLRSLGARTAICAAFEGQLPADY